MPDDWQTISDWEDASPEAPARPFPTPGQTAKDALYGAAMMPINAVKGISRLSTTEQPMMAPVKEIYAMATGQPSPGVQQIQGAYQGVKDIFTPAYKTATAGAGTITPEEMTKAAEGGGAAVAALATPFAPKVGRAIGGSKVGQAVGEAGKGLSGAITKESVGKVLKFAGTGGAIALGEAVFPGATMAARVVGAIIKSDAVRNAIGSIATDKALTAAIAGDDVAAAQVLSRVAERNPAAAEAMAKAAAEAADPREIAKAMTRVPPEVHARAVEASRLRMEALREKLRPKMTEAQRNAEVRKIIGPPLPGKAGTIPAPGNVKPATIFSNPRTPAGRPLTAPQRTEAIEALIEKQRALEAESGLSIADIFGIGGDN